MKKKLLEQDGFYIVLFVCICLVAIGGIWFTNRNVNELASNNDVIEKEEKEEKENEIHFVEKDNTTPTTTDPEQSLEEAKEEANKEESKKEESDKEVSNEKVVVESKLGFLGSEVIREYSETKPSYSQTLDLWEVHKALDVSANVGSEVRNLLQGEVVEVFNDPEHGMSVSVKSEDNIVVTYSNLGEDILLEKGQLIEEGSIVGLVGKTSFVESEETPHVHIEAFKDDVSIDPMTLIN